MFLLWREKETGKPQEVIGSGVRGSTHFYSLDLIGPGKLL